MKTICSREQTRNNDYNCMQAGVSSLKLMLNAGKALLYAYNYQGKKTLIVSGGGNNGGDGLVVAAHLIEAGVKVKVYLISLPKTDAAKLMYNNLCDIDSNVISTDFNDFDNDLSRADIVVDAIFGTGFKGNVDGLSFNPRTFLPALIAPDDTRITSFP